MKRPNILIFSVTFEPFVGGAEVAVKEIVKRLPDFEFHLITLRIDRALPKLERRGNLTVYRIGLTSPAGRGLSVNWQLTLSKYSFPFLALFKALRLNRRLQFKVVWSIMANYAGFAALFYKWLTPQTAFLLTLQEGDDLEYLKRRTGLFLPVFKKIFERADRLQTISNFLADFAQTMGCRKRPIVVPNGVDLENFSRPISQAELDSVEKLINRQPGDIFLITASRLVGKNAVDVIVRAMAGLPADHKLLIVGRGAEEENLRKLTKELKLEDRVIFGGFVEHRNLPIWFAVADIFVRPSRSEGLGNSFLEALAAGRPIIGTPVGGIPDFLKDGETGLFCQTDNPSDLVEKIKRLSENPALRNRLAQNGRKLIVERYSWEIVARQMEEIFRKLTDRFGTAERKNLKILITTGIYPPRIGGPAQYAKNLKEFFKKKGHQVAVATFRTERFLPSGLRHFYFFIKILPKFLISDFVIALDTFSVGLPSVLAGKILKRKVIIRTGGDFLWEQYVERTGKKVLLKNFYKTEIGHFSFKEKIIFKLTKWTLRNCSALVFSTDWQKQIWRNPYKFNVQKTFIVENYYGPKQADNIPAKKIFIGAVRNLRWKNLDVLQSAFARAKEKDEELILDLENLLFQQFLEKLKNCYAVILVSLGDVSPNLILDAISFNKPFILTEECGLGNKVKEIGIFVDPLNEEEIKKKILWLADKNNYLAAKKKVTGFNFTHSWEEIASEFLEIYKRI